jgi:hypothetical protein
MGKSDNIKRAKRLKEAKRKRELDALVQDANGPASIELRKRNASNGAETQINKGKVKNSDLLKQFVYPLLRHTDSLEEVKRKFKFAMFAWNAATVREISEKEYQKIKNDATSLVSDSSYLLELFQELVNKKNEKYAQHKVIFIDFELQKLYKTDFEISVAAVPLEHY